jgi:hypothetical protein
MHKKRSNEKVIVTSGSNPKDQNVKSGDSKITETTEHTRVDGWG